MSQPPPMPPKGDASYTIFLEKRLGERESENEALLERIANQEELIAQQEDDYVELLRKCDELSRELRFSKGEARTANALADWYATSEHEREEL